MHISYRRRLCHKNYFGPILAIFFTLSDLHVYLLWVKNLPTLLIPPTYIIFLEEIIGPPQLFQPPVYSGL